jgi:hypothetical protein
MLLKYAAPTRFECRHCQRQLPLGDASSVPGFGPKLSFQNSKTSVNR